uniref:Uncharacterized protein n=1 Tax=Ixodes ricinus TaxID=34613 RepID=A0A6B0UQ17_IXORI
MSVRFSWSSASLSSLSSRAWFSRSSGNPPLRDGYSQFRSSPSKPWRSRNSSTLSTNLFLPSAVFDMLEYFSDPSFQPPMAMIVFKSGFSSLRSLNFLYMPRPELSVRSREGSFGAIVSFSRMANE